MPAKGTSKKDGTLSKKDLETLKKANKASQSPASRKKRSATMAATAAVKQLLGYSGRLTPLVQDYLRSVLMEKDANGTTFLQNYIQNFLNEAKTDPNSNASRMLATAIFSNDLFAKLDEEINKQMNKDIEFKQYQIRKTLYDKQQEVFDDEKDKIILVINSRRSGKTEMMGRLLAKRVCRPDQHCVYVNRSFDAAVRQIQKPLETALNAAGLHYTGTVSGGKLEFDNGSWILIIGNNNVADVNKVRGERIALFIGDEIGHMRNTRQLINEVVQPATIDYADSQIVLVGTPPRTKNGYVHDLWENEKIKKFHWTFEDNPFIPNREKVIEEVCTIHGTTPDDPFIQREYYGRMDAYDADAMTFRDYKLIDTIPQYAWDYAFVGVDWGFDDKAAVVSVLANKAHKVAYIAKTWSEAKKSTSEICTEVQNQVKWLKDTFSLAREPQVICDTNDKSGAYELYQTYKIKNVTLAYKYNRDLALEQLGEWLRTGVIYTHKENNTRMIEDFDNTLWKRDDETDKVEHTIDDDVWHPNAAMALLYISRQFAYNVLGHIDTNADAKHILGVDKNA